jgi:hypothetical protein
MYARSMSGREDWTRIENTIPFVRQGMHPVITEIEGNQGLCMLLDQHGRRFVVISGWETQQAMHASDQTVAPLRAEAARMLGGSPDVQEWEVAALQRTADLEPGNWVSVACVGTDPGNVDRVVDTFRDTVLPAAANLPGCRGAMLLVDRDEGRVASAVTFESYPTLHSAHKAGPLHDLSGAGLVTGPDDVRDYEIDIADVRLPDSI